MYPEAVYIIAGDFNHANLDAVLPKFHQLIKCAIRGANTLNKVYSNIKQGYRVKPLPHTGQSEPMSLLSGSSGSEGQKIMDHVYSSIRERYHFSPICPYFPMSWSAVFHHWFLRVTLKTLLTPSTNPLCQSVSTTYTCPHAI